MTEPASSPPARRIEVNVGTRTMLLAVAIGGIVALAILSLGSLLAIFVAAVLALGLDPVVTALVRRGWSRGTAALLVFAGLFVAVVAIFGVTVGPLWGQIKDFIDHLPQYWDQLSQSSVIKHISNKATDDSVRSALQKVVSGVPDAANALLGFAGGVFGSFLSLTTLVFLALFLLIERPTITDGVFGLMTPSDEARWRPVVDDSIGAISQSLIGNLAISLVAAIVAGLSAWLLGLPFPIVLAVIVGFLDLIPNVGATIAAILLALVALTVGTAEAVVVLIIQLIYQQVENYIVYPIVYRRAVELSPFTTIVAVLIAGSLLGVVGAILAVPFAAVIRIVLTEAGRPRRERMAELRA